MHRHRSAFVSVLGSGSRVVATSRDVLSTVYSRVAVTSAWRHPQARRGVGHASFLTGYEPSTTTSNRPAALANQTSLPVYSSSSCDARTNRRRTRETRRTYVSPRRATPAPRPESRRCAGGTRLAVGVVIREHGKNVSSLTSLPRPKSLRGQAPKQQPSRVVQRHGHAPACVHTPRAFPFAFSARAPEAGPRPSRLRVSSSAVPRATRVAPLAAPGPLRFGLDFGPVSSDPHRRHAARGAKAAGACRV